MTIERHQVSEMIRKMLSSVLKGNPVLKKGLLTGIYDTLDHSGLNNVNVYSIADRMYC